jgi:hypothetical protein
VQELETLRFVFERGHHVLFGVAVVVLFSASVAAEPGSPQGDEESARYQLIYEAPALCPQKQVLIEQINRRLEGEWQASPDRLPGTLAVVVRQEGERYEAHMTLADRWGHVAFRTLEGEDCDAVLWDVAVAAVSAIESRLGPQPPFFEFGATTGPDWRGNLLAWGGGGLVGLRWPASRRSLQLSVGYWATGARQANQASDVEIRVRLFAARLEFCLLEPRLSQTISFPLCAGAAGGLLEPQGVMDTGGASASRGWASLGLAPKLRWNVNRLFVQIGPRMDVFVLHPRRLTDTPRVSGQRSQSEAVHSFPNIGLAVMATVGFSLP